MPGTRVQPYGESTNNAPMENVPSYKGLMVRTHSHGDRSERKKPRSGWAKTGEDGDETEMVQVEEERGSERAGEKIGLSTFLPQCSMDIMTPEDDDTKPWFPSETVRLPLLLHCKDLLIQNEQTGFTTAQFAEFYIKNWTSKDGLITPFLSSFISNAYAEITYIMCL